MRANIATPARTATCVGAVAWTARCTGPAEDHTTAAAATSSCPRRSASAGAIMPASVAIADGEPCGEGVAGTAA